MQQSFANARAQHTRTKLFVTCVLRTRSHESFLLDWELHTGTLFRKQRRLVGKSTGAFHAARASDICIYVFIPTQGYFGNLSPSLSINASRRDGYAPLLKMESICGKMQVGIVVGTEGSLLLAKLHATPADRFVHL